MLNNLSNRNSEQSDSDGLSYSVSWQSHKNIKNGMRLNITLLSDTWRNEG